MYIPVEHEHIPLVVIDNFLPRDYVTKLYEDFIKLKPHFGVPHWSGGYNDGVLDKMFGFHLTMIKLKRTKIWVIMYQI